MSESMYFIAVVPPQKVQEEVTQLKVLMAERFHSKQALKSPPHITLHMPFKWKESKIGKLELAIKKINAEVQTFKVELDGFAFFEPRVVYVDLAKNAKLIELQKNVVEVGRKELNLENGNYKNRPFRPHMTIGFRDLKKPDFYDAKKYFQNREFSARFMVKEVKLLKHNGKKWDII
ncbi:MAG: 2'-5' RNA ligase family protein [Bacteroidota bacterium]